MAASTCAGGAFDLFLAADALQRLQMLLRGVELRLGLRVGDLRFVHQLARQRALLEQLLAVVEQLLGGVERLLRAASTSVCALVICSGTPAPVVDR